MESRFTDLEIRLAHQETALEELTRTVVRQAQAIEFLRQELEQLLGIVRELAPSAVAPLSEEGPPPHY